MAVRARAGIPLAIVASAGAALLVLGAFARDREDPPVEIGIVTPPSLKISKHEVSDSPPSPPKESRSDHFHRTFREAYAGTEADLRGAEKAFSDEMMLIARREGERSHPLLREILTRPEHGQSIQQQVLNTLQTQASRPNFEFLFELMASGEILPALRASAVYTLGNQLGNGVFAGRKDDPLRKEVRARHRLWLESPDGEIRAAAVCKYFAFRSGEWSPETVRAVFQRFIRDPSPSVRSRVAYLVRYAAKEDQEIQRTAREVFVSSPTPSARAAALQVLGAAGKEAARSAALEALGSGNDELRRMGIWVAAEVGLDEAVPQMALVLNGTDENLRFHARKALAKLGSRAAADALFEAAFELEDPGIQERILQSLEAVVSLKNDSEYAGRFIRQYEAETHPRLRRKLMNLVAATRTGEGAAWLRGRYEKLGLGSPEGAHAAWNLLYHPAGGDFVHQEFALLVKSDLATEAIDMATEGSPTAAVATIRSVYRPGNPLNLPREVRFEMIQQLGYMEGEEINAELRRIASFETDEELVRDLRRWAGD